MASSFILKALSATLAFAMTCAETLATAFARSISSLSSSPLRFLSLSLSSWASRWV